MANHRPKSLSELNNVYDKAMRAERAIKESSSLFSTPETNTPPASENIFEQLETKAAEAQKSQVFDPDITNIANDFLKRYAQPEKPKPAPKEIKRPAPSIQVYHTPVKEQKPEVPAEVPVAVRPQSALVHKPASTIPPTESVQPAPVMPEVKEPVEAIAPEVPAEIPAAVIKAPEIAAPAPKTPTVSKAPAARKTPAKTASRVDHTPRPNSRVRITSTERNELMEEYLKVMSDDDDEPSIRRPKFSFFKKKKKYDDEDYAEPTENIYEDDFGTDENSAEEEIPVVPFDDSEVRYEDEYSNSPEDGFITEDDELPNEAMNLYDYIEADFDYEINDEYEEEAEEDFTESEATEEIPEEIQAEVYEAEEIMSEAQSVEEYTDETAEVIADEAEEILSEETVAEEVIVPEEVSFEEAVAEEIVYEDNEAAEEIIPTEEEAVAVIAEEAQEVIYPEAPTAGMVFEDIFSVSDENKRSHTGGNWNEVFGEQSYEASEEAEEAYIAYEENALEEPEAYENIQEEIPQENAEVAEEEPEEIAEDTDEEIEEEEAEPVKRNLAAKIIMSISIVLCVAIAFVSIFSSAVLGVDKRKIFSDKYRAFSATETVTEFGINKGDLVITENTYAAADQLYVYAHETNGEYRIGKVTSTTTNLMGDYLYITQTSEGVKLINRDTSMGVITATYSGIGSVLSVICDYGIFIAIACAVFALALIICLVIIIRKQRRYEAAAAIYDNPDNFRNDDDDDSSDSDSDNNSGEYYSDYDTDGIEQGLFAEL